MNKDIKTFFNSVFNIFLIVLGLVICSYFFYIRIILVRVPHKITYSWNIYLFSFYLCLILLYVVRIKAYIFPSKETILSKTLKFIFFPIVSLYEKALFKLYILLFHNYRVEILTKGLYYFCVHFKDFCLLPFMLNDKYLYEKLLFYCIIQLFPRMLILITLFIDTIIYQELYYLYKVLWLILIPFFFNIFYYIMNQFNIRRFKELELCFTIKIKHNTKNYILEIIEKHDIIQKYYSFSDKMIEQGKEDIYMYFIIYKHFLEIFDDQLLKTSRLYLRLQLFLNCGYCLIFTYNAYKLFCNYYY